MRRTNLIRYIGTHAACSSGAEFQTRGKRPAEGSVIRPNVLANKNP
jgi:hypothetical protein